MELPSRLIEAAVDQMASLPGIGRKTALRLVLNLLRRSDEQVEAFSESFQLMRQGVRGCATCHNLTESERCSICINPLRKENLICVVEDLRDLLAIEATGQFQGRYHVLGGVISPMEGVGPNDLNIESLVIRAGQLTQDDDGEIIFALPATMEGETTAFYLFRKLSSFNLQVTSIARGIAVGEDLQHADEATLVQSLRQRLPYTN
ncbi:recombination mediator RecR [Flavobacteriales bacterium]|jgi:recombination protein RecR|nr:recombination mediator RecR [Flavobacteriales bacterium]MDC0854399.1 recombination mediator RecR [Flavobacteriales bacterium]